GLVSPYRPYGRPIVDQNNTCDPSKNSRIMGHMPMWLARGGPHGHTHTITRPCVRQTCSRVSHTANHTANHMARHTPV
ncbi:hypothetical protein J1N35_034475, partial [Gossypium stocksii]